MILRPILTPSRARRAELATIARTWLSAAALHAGADDPPRLGALHAAAGALFLAAVIAPPR